MITSRCLRIALLAGILAGTLCAGSARGDDAAVKLARVSKVGDTFGYTLTVDFSINGMEGTVTQSARSEVKEIRPNGDVVTAEASTGGHVSVAGQEQDIPASALGTEIRTPRGILVERKADDGAQSPFSPEVQRLMAQTSDTVLPDKAVKPGDTWTTELENPLAKDKKVTIKGTYAGIEKVDGQDCWKITQASEADNGAGGKVSFDTTYWLDPANGHLVRAEGSAKDLPAQIGVMSYKMKIASAKSTAPAKPDPGQQK